MYTCTTAVYIVLWNRVCIRGVRRCFGMGGLTMWAAHPRGVWGHASPGNVCML